MKKTLLDLQEFIEVLQQLQEDGTKTIIFLEHEGFPAMIDADSQDSLYVFKSVDDMDDNDKVH